MNPFFEKIQFIAAQEQISQHKAFISEIQKIFLEEFYSSPHSRGWILIGGANLKFVYQQKRHTKDIDLGQIEGTTQDIEETLRSLKLLEYPLEKRIGTPVAIKVDDEKTIAHIHIYCQELGGPIRFEIEFTHFQILSSPEKAKLGSALVLGTSLKEMKISKIFSLMLRPNLEVRDLFDIFLNPEPIDSSLFKKYLKKFKKTPNHLKMTVEKIQNDLMRINQKLIKELQEDLGISETKKYISDPQDTALIERVLREIKSIL